MSNNVRVLEPDDDIGVLRRRHRHAYLLACLETGNRPPCTHVLDQWWPGPF